MHTIQVDHLAKSFGSVQAVKDVSFEVNAGEIFGLLGPNGAGKTTIIRCILEIFKADKGTVSVLGGPMTEEKLDQIGYLPEERGLYQEITLEGCLGYLAGLKGLKNSDAQERMDEYLHRFELTAYKKKKIKEMSKGMQQKAQLIATLIHKPRIIIVDEPFSALDPINTQTVKEILIQQKSDGATIVMSSHQMHQVEELCDRLVLINKGTVLLYGNLQDIRNRFAGNSVFVHTVQALPARIKGVTEIIPNHHGALLKLEPSVSANTVLKDLIRQDIILDEFHIAVPSLDDIFIKVVREQAGQHE